MVENGIYSCYNVSMTNDRRLIMPTLILTVAIAGASQGLTLPLLSLFLERLGVSSVANGFNSTALYVGILLVSPWLETPLRRLGYKTMILIGLTMVSITTLCFPLLKGYAIWFVLRFLLGIGDSALHYASQMWVTAIAPPERRGMDISLYGFAYGAGFSLGPLGMLLEPYGIWYPFLAICVTYLVVYLLLARLQNAYPEPVHHTEDTGSKRWLSVAAAGWLPLIPSLLYAYMEASLNVSFPVFAVRAGIPVRWLSIILPSFVIGSLILQLPLGRLSDKVGRKWVMMVCATIGGLGFLAFPYAIHSLILMVLLLVLAGATVGSFYSLGLAFAADILPKYMIPTVGIIASMNFGIASIIAPNLNGFIIDSRFPGGFFTLIGVLLIAFSISGFFFRVKKTQENTA